MRVVRALVALAAVTVTPALQAQQRDSPAQAQALAVGLRPGETLLEVATTGTHQQRPDVLTLEAEIEVSAETPREALDSVSTVGNRLGARLRELGIRPEDIRTQRIGVYPQWDTDAAERAGRRPRILGYKGGNSLEVRVRDLNRAPRIFEALIAAGANDVRGPNFSLSEPAAARRLARLEAIRLAREQAEAYAEALEMRVVRVIRVSERDLAAENVNNFFGGFVTAGGASRRPEFEPGEIPTSVRVWVDFALAPRWCLHP